MLNRRIFSRVLSTLFLQAVVMLDMPDLLEKLWHKARTLH
jgi:hypothetical protein